jgi:hypothetical protein
VADAFTGTVVPYHIEDAKLIHSDGDEEHVPVDVEYGQNGDWTLKVEKTPRAYKPGRYTLALSMIEGSQTYQDTVDFYWGVLAMNTDKTPYQPGDMARLSLAALDQNGDTLCDARLSLSIVAPSGDRADVPVSPGGGCGKNNVTELPDYVAEYPVSETGSYQMILSMLDPSGAVITSTADAFESTSTPRFTIARTGPTRIYPPSSYVMALTVTAHEGLDGTLREAVPEGFIVSDTGGAIVLLDQKPATHLAPSVQSPPEQRRHDLNAAQPIRLRIHDLDSRPAQRCSGLRDAGWSCRMAHLRGCLAGFPGANRGGGIGLRIGFDEVEAGYLALLGHLLRLRRALCGQSLPKLGQPLSPPLYLLPLPLHGGAGLLGSVEGGAVMVNPLLGACFRATHKQT